MRSLKIITAALALSLSPVGAALADPHAAPAYLVIVNPSNQATRVDRSFLEDAFLKKTTRWPNGDVIKPADLAPDSPVRRQFSEDIVHRSVQAVKVYWQQRIFSGRDVPPPEFDHDDEAVKYVLKHDGAVGYVSPRASLHGSKPVVVQ